jgi:hypothetical protein
MFQKDSRTESFLSQMGVGWKYTNGVRSEQLKPNWFKENQGRRGSQPQNTDAIDEYAALMEMGSPAPAPILNKSATGHAVLDGVQRLSAHIIKRQQTIFPAYVCSITDDQTILIIRTFANTRLCGSYAPSRRDSIVLALANLIINSDRPLSLEDIASIGGWSVKDIKSEYCRLEVVERLRRIGVPYEVATQLKKGVAIAMYDNIPLHDFEAAPEIVGHFARDLISARFENGDSEQFVKQFASVKRNKGEGVLRQQLQENYDEFITDPEVLTRLSGRQKRSMPSDCNVKRALLAAKTACQNAVNSKEIVYNVNEFFDIISDIRALIVKMKKGKDCDGNS